MAISQKDIKLLWGRAASRCSMCRIELAHDKQASNESYPIGEQAHIVAEEQNGPRGNSILPIADRNSYHNLILLCPTHHVVIDKNVDDFPIENLHLIKSKHELWVLQTLTQNDILIEEPIGFVRWVSLFRKLSPILYWLHRQTPKDEAFELFLALQEFWSLRNLVNEEIDLDLRSGLDCLLRPLAGKHNVIAKDPSYVREKISISYIAFQRFFGKRGSGWLNIDNSDSEWDIINQLDIELSVAYKSPELSDLENRIIGHALLILNYYHDYSRNQGYIDVHEGLTTQFATILQPFFARSLKVKVPQPLDFDELDDMHNICFPERF